MCLSNRDEEPTRKQGIGYKVVRITKDSHYVCFDHIVDAGNVEYPLNKWVTDPKDGVADTPHETKKYRTGFHISLDKKVLTHNGYDNKDERFIKVKFRDVTATQTKDIDETYGRQVVARDIMNLGEI